MSKLQIEDVEDAVKEILKLSGEKKRKFTETIELQIALKNYDPSKDKRFTGSIRLPHIPRDRFSVCVLGTAQDCDRSQAAGVEFKSVEDLKKLNKNKKLVKKLANEFSAFIASSSLIRKIPRLLGPGLNKAGKFPATLGDKEDIADKVADIKASVKFQLKSKKTTCIGVAISNVSLSAEDTIENVILAVNFLVSLLPKNWQQVKKLYLKSTMGPSQKIFGM
jgi:large subunit ribosomal protein L10Ae